jgi:hypothetical protein
MLLQNFVLEIARRVGPQAGHFDVPEGARQKDMCRLPLPSCLGGRRSSSILNI